MAKAFHSGAGLDSDVADALSAQLAGSTIQCPTQAKTESSLADDSEMLTMDTISSVIIFEHKADEIGGLSPEVDAEGSHSVLMLADVAPERVCSARRVPVPLPPTATEVCACVCVCVSKQFLDLCSLLYRGIGMGGSWCWLNGTLCG
jgi:hypothetical protein